MECNRDEATRAKVIAEKKFEAKDIKGAKKFALKAKSLFPGLDGIQQILSTLDVYIAAETKINGESDWYGILGVDPTAVDVTVRKHYMKLALLLHPDKNKSIGAEGAFKLISESWSVLSDKARRSAFDQKRKSKKPAPQKVPPPSNMPRSTPCPKTNAPKSTPSPQTNGFQNFTKSACRNNSNAHTKQPSTNNSKASSSRIPPPPPPTHKEKTKTPPTHKEKTKTTFWTICHSCLVQHEYLRIYLHHNLQCPDCRQPFFAKESDTAPNPSEVINQKKEFDRQNLNNISGTGTDGGAGSSQAASMVQPGTGTDGGAGSSQAASMVQQAYEHVKRKRVETQAAAKTKKTQASKKTAGDSKRRKVNEGPKETEPKNGISELFKAYTSPTKKGNGDNNNTVQQENRTILTEKARLSIHKNLKDASISESLEKKDNTGKEPQKEITMDVPNPHFYVFDNDRAEQCFGENEVWAVYDDDDGMPRHYAMITSVVSLNPFKVKLNWLKSKFNNEHDDKIWHHVGSGLRKTCGIFGLGKLEVYTSLNSFSHKVKWTKKGDDDEGDIHIFPEKGDVWAVYKNWSPDWDEMTSEEDIHSYNVVEVLKDYDENTGVSVIPLVKVAGFKTLFHNHLDPKEAVLIRKEDMSRFSHRIPCHLLRGQEEEVPSYLKGCWELDPASTPLQHQVIIANSEEGNAVEIQGDKARVGADKNIGTS